MKKNIFLHDQIDEKKLIICAFEYKIFLYDQIDEKKLIICAFEYKIFLYLNHRVDKKAFYILHLKRMYLIHGNETLDDSFV